MPAQYISRTRTRVDRLISRLDRSRGQTAVHNIEEEGDFLESPSVGEEDRALLQGRFAPGTVHTGRVERVDGGGHRLVITFGLVRGFLPTDQLGGASRSSIKVGAGRVRVVVVELDGQLRAKLTRRGL